MWKEIPGFENYLVSENGEIFSKKSNKKLKIATANSGYKCIILYKDGKQFNRFVHRLVAISFFGKSDLQVNHKDGDKFNNSLENLEYCTQSENQIHSLRNGLRKYKYPREIVDSIIELRKTGMTQGKIAKVLNIKKSFVKDVTLGRTRKIL